MATVGDVGHWIYMRLMAKPRRIYLVAMWILCGELRELYAPWATAGEEPLMASTMDLVRDVVIGGETEETAACALDLAEAWEAFRRAHWAEAPGGLVNTWARPSRCSIGLSPGSPEWSRRNGIRCGSAPSSSPAVMADYHAQDLADVALCEAIRAKNEPGLPYDKFMAALEAEESSLPGG